MGQRDADVLALTGLDYQFTMHHRVRMFGKNMNSNRVAPEAICSTHVARGSSYSGGCLFALPFVKEESAGGMIASTYCAYWVFVSF